jgi:cytochrome c-type biogenesis protein CcmH/NrfF
MKKHELDPFSLVFGAIFAVLGVAFLAARPDVSTWPGGWAWPIPILVLGGMIIVLAALRRNGEDLVPADDTTDAD